MAQALAFAKMRSASVRLSRVNMAERLQLKFHHRLFAQPIRWDERRQYAGCTNARRAGVGERQQQQFKFDLGAVFCAPNKTCDCATIFVGYRGQQIVDLLAVWFAP